MDKRQWSLIPTYRDFVRPIHPWGTFAQVYCLHTQDRRAFFERAPYRFYEDVPKGFSGHACAPGKSP